MIHLAKSLAAKLWLLLLLLLIVTALVSGLGRVLTPVVSHYQDEVEQWAAESLGQPVRIGKLEASWSGLRPQLVLKDFALISRESKDPVLQLAEARVTLAPVDSLLSGAVQSYELTLTGVKLLIKRRSDGSVITDGLEGVGSGEGNASALFLIPNRINVEQSEIHWQNLAIGAAPVRLSNVNARLRNAGRRHQLNLSFDPPGAQGSQVTLAADIKGELDQPRGWSGEFYLRGQRLTLTELLKPRIPEGYQLRKGQAEIELWSGWEKGKMRWLEGKSHWSDLHLVQLTAAEDSPNRRLEIDHLGGYFRWRYQTDGWDLMVEDIRFERLGLSWPATSFGLSTRFDPQGRLHLRSGADFLRVEDAGAIVRMFPLPYPQLEQALASIRPHSDLHDPRFHYDEGPAGITWAARGEVRGLFSKPWKRIPGVENLSAHFWVDQTQGTLQISGRDTTLWFPGLFRDPLVLQQLQGPLTWRQRPDGGWRVDTPGLRAVNADIKTRTRLRMDFPQTAGEGVFMDLQTDFEDGDASATARYLPVGIMRPAVIKWLDRSIVSGQVISGSCVVRGPLRDFPFHKTHSGRFEVYFQTEELLLDYWPEWPALQKASADVRFLGNSFDTWIRHARLADNRITGAHGRIRDLKRTSPFELGVQTDGDIRNILNLLQNSPLSKDFGAMTELLEVGGEASLKLNLAIPITDGSPFQLAGKLNLRDAILELPDSPLTISSIRGALHFDHENVRAQAIEGLLFGNPLSVDVETLDGETRISRVMARGAINGTRLAALAPDPTGNLFRGTGNWRLQLDIPSLSASQTTPLRADLHSDLLGMAIELPAPLGKSARERRDLRISGEWGKQPLHPLRLSYGSVFGLAAQLDTSPAPPKSIERMGIHLGEGNARLPATPGIEIDGKLEQLDLTPWLELVKGQSQGFDPPPLRRIDLQFDRLSWQQVTLEQLHLDLEHDRDALTGSVSGQYFDGRIRIPDDLQRQPIDVRLSRLELTFDPEGDSPSPQQPKAGSSNLDPTQLPALTLSADLLKINQREFGSLQLTTERLPHGLGLQTLAILQPDKTEIKARGHWLNQIPESHQSSIEFTLKTEDLGRLLTDLGYTANVKQAPTKIDASLHWAGTPQEINAADIDGSLHMDIGKGQLLEVNPGLGGRVFALLNVNALQRRLTLDFSDLFDKGFSFDSIKGDFRLEQGNAYTENFRIKGPAARIDLSGRIGLAAEDLDQRVEVTPKVSSALPVAAAVLGTPAVGAAVLVAQQLLGKEVDKATRTNYHVTGPWNDPVITRIRKKDKPTESEAEQQTESPPDIFSQGN